MSPAQNAARPQPLIFAQKGALGLSLTYRCADRSAARAALVRLRDGFDVARGALGIGEPLALALKKTITGLRTFPALSGVGHSVPSTQGALWIALRGDDRGELFDRARSLDAALAPAFERDDTLETFVYRGGRDLTGYEDGTENPKGTAASAAAIASLPVKHGSFVAVQRWAHDLAAFEKLPAKARDHAIGRSRETNAELADAPESAHVKRAAQESYEPGAFMLRRSMPWAHGARQGLEFVAYGADLDRFERVLRRMLGQDDGIVDALFQFSRPETGGYYFCPPCRGNVLDLGCLGL